MDLHQLQCMYQMEDDRILLRLSFKAEDGSLQEIRAWLTRRMVRNLWPCMIQSLETQVTLDQPLAAHASAEIVEMEHQASVSAIREGGNFNVPFESDIQAYPIGETPVLVTTMQFIMHPNQPLRIDFVTSAGASFEVTFAPTILHGFCTLLQESVKAAEWDIELRLPGGTDAIDAGAEPRTLN